MIIQKLLISKETVIRKLPKNYKQDDYKFFAGEIKKKLSDCFLYQIDNVKIYHDGSLSKFNLSIIKNYLGFKSISSLKIPKKIFLLFKYLIKIFYLNFIVFNKNKKVTKLDKIIIMYDRNSQGYFHWINDILPKLLILEKKRELRHHIVIIPYTFKQKFIRDSLKFFNLKVMFINKDQIILSKKCLYLGDISESGNPRPRFINQLRKKFKDDQQFKIKGYEKYDKVYVSRRYSRRNLINEKNFEKYLKSKNFQICYMEKISFIEQVRILNNCQILIGPYGAGLINCFWLNKKSTLIDIRPNNDFFSNCFFSAASALNLNYYYILSKKKKLLSTTKTSSYYLSIKNFNNEFLSIIK